MQKKIPSLFVIFTLLFSIISMIGFSFVKEASAGTFPGVNGKIAITTGGPSFYGGLYTINPDGTDLTYLPGDSQYPVTVFGRPNWSPDGTKIAVLGCRFYGGINCIDGGLAYFNGDGSGVNHPINWDELGAPGTISPWNPSWSPDGTRLSLDGFGVIYLINADGSGPVLMDPSGCGPPPNCSLWVGGASEPTWGPSETGISFVSSACVGFSSGYYGVNCNAYGGTIYRGIGFVIPDGVLYDFFIGPPYSDDSIITSPSW